MGWRVALACRSHPDELYRLNVQKLYYIHMYFTLNLILQSVRNFADRLMTLMSLPFLD